MQRKDIKDKIMSSTTYIQLAEMYPEIAEILDHFINGNYSDF